MMLLPLIFFCCTTLSFAKVSVAVDTLAPYQTLSDNGQTFVSANQTFELGFFSPWNSNNRYVGIWFKNVPQQTPVWVANKNNPLPDSSGVLTINTTGNIVIANNRTSVVIWSSNSSSTGLSSPILQLLDTGNLVLKNDGTDDNSGNYLWQSFDHPCDTLIPGMKLGWNLRTNLEWYLTSWRSLQDPSSGDYTYRVDPRGLPQIVLRRSGSQVTYRSGPWDGVRFGGGPQLKQNAVFNPIFVFDADNIYYTFGNNDESTITRFVVNQSGLIQFLTWSDRQNAWIDITKLQADNCDNYASCGPYGICQYNGQLVCQCPKGFTPRLPTDWARLDWTGGCVLEKPLNCSEPQGFRRFSGLKLPDTSYFLVNRTSMNPVECEEACLRNCSCVAYAKTEISGCVVWFGDLIDIKSYSEGGQDLYIRMAASELRLNNKAKRKAAIASVSVISGVLLWGLISWYSFWKRTAKRKEAQQENKRSKNSKESQEENQELPLFDLDAIFAATDKFSSENKIGQGGFGTVYKGELHGQEIAVKRLSQNSSQGLQELKNEIILIAKLQHRNLVRLLGCCIQGEERMLVYEYLPNKSLDNFIFDQIKRKLLPWKKRFNIVLGIGRGLLYLHQDSRLRIIHRDLKPSNILLDSEMNPKISDFGIARIFGGDHTEEKTKRIMGTYGYMSPEYAMSGHFSMKSDVFSFGVIALEIISGQKNSGFYHPDHDLNLVGYAWNLWNEENPLELMDTLLEESFSLNEVLRCIQVALLCVQQRAEDRPTMSSVVFMLSNESIALPRPKEPGFCTEGKIDPSFGGQNPSTANELTVTILDAR